MTQRLRPADGSTPVAVVIPNAQTNPTLGVNEVAPLFHCSTWALYEAIKRDDFPVPVLRIGRKIRIPTQPLLELLGLA